ncbi:hypothetical protein O1611_g2626 [Lasiodiplodia mahajangana]|uniref:Uncharacterized protein n=1 Tax=Lasiodiplodia mahajangana TaxID=1108764 RepID=A0ACC2JTZ7_9PEZI|nr:hypothetical protein O1611_g2626 [Lasiodiplodia mahajangana]
MVMLKRKRATGRTSNNNGKGSLNHVLLPKYTPFGPSRSPDLQRAKYKPRNLLYFAAQAFHSREDVDLSLRQRAFRHKFVKLFNDRQDNYATAFEDEQLQDFERDMTDFLRCLDSFFFFGCLERHIELDVGMDLVSMEDPSSNQRWEGRTASSTVGGRHFIQIWLNLGRNGQVYDLETLVGNLVHEMVHAWYFLFSCTCKSCERDLLNTTGHPSDHHGPLFLMLHRLIVTEIRRWDEELTDFLADDCPKDEVSRSAMKSFQSFMEELDVDERRKYNTVRSSKFAPHMFIKLTDEGNVIVRPQLKFNQLSFEEAMKGEALREKELAGELAQYEGVIDEETNDGEVKERSVDSRKDKGTQTEVSPDELIPLTPIFDWSALTSEEI